MVPLVRGILEKWFDGKSYPKAQLAVKTPEKVA